MASVEVAAVMVGDGSYELMRLDEAVNSTMSVDRIEARNRVLLEKAVCALLPYLELEEGMRRVFAGAVSVSLDQWLFVKRTLGR
jgi:hypothetical protein